MIAVESFKRFRYIDLAMIVLLALLSYAFDWLSLLIPNMQWSFIISTLATTVLMAFTALLIRKAGSVTMFYIARALLTYKIAGLGLNVFPTLITAGIIFELIFLILKLDIKNIPADITLGAAVSNASIPATTALLLSTEVIKTMTYSFVNLILLYTIIGVAGAVISFVIWYNLKFTRIVMKFEYMQ